MRVPRSCKVYTPEALANAIVAAMGDQPNDLWLEPCSGKGAFIEALAKTGVPASRIVAIDLETKASHSDNLATSHRGTEFLGWSLLCNHRFSKIVANPPFVSFRRLPARLQSVADRLNCQWAGPSSGNSNLWFAFLRASLSLLKKGGSIGFIVPAAFEYAGYASTLRQRIPKHFAEFEVHRCREPLFEDVRDGCVVLIGRNYELPNDRSVRREYDSADELIRNLGHIGRSTSLAGPANQSKRRNVSVKLSEVLSIRIGCVTGDARYFLLRESDRVRLRLPIQVLHPVLTRAQQLKTAVVTKAVWETLREHNERIWLFRPHRRDLNLPSVRKYLRLRPEDGGCNKRNYKVRVRNVWYSPDLPAKVDGFLSGSSRLGPWISLQQYERLSATNTLYYVTFNEHLSKNAKSAWALSFLTGQFRQQISRIVRLYPDGLEKLEPGDLMCLQVPIPPRDRGAVSAYRKAIRLLMNEGPTVAQKFADEWFG